MLSNSQMRPALEHTRPKDALETNPNVKDVETVRPLETPMLARQPHRNAKDELEVGG